MSLMKQVLAVLVLGAFIAGGYFAWDRVFPQSEASTAPQRGGGAATTVETAPVRMQSMPRIVEAVGTTFARQFVEVVAQTEGRVESINFRSGQKVERGHILLELDRDLEEANLKEAEAAFRQAELELERATSLSTSDIVSRSRLDELNSRLASADAAVARAQRRLADRTVRAPFAGTLGISRVDIGARVSPTTVLTTLDDLTSVQVEFAIAEELFGVARIGQPVSARSAAFPGRNFEGEVIEVDSRIDAVSRSFRVRAELPNPDGILPAGMFMHVSMTLATGDVVVVPEEAVIADADIAYVYRVEENVAKRQLVRLGRRAFGVAEVLEGVALDDLVVTRGTVKLRDGMAVRIVNESAEVN